MKSVFCQRRCSILLNEGSYEWIWEPLLNSKTKNRSKMKMKSSINRSSGENLCPKLSVLILCFFYGNEEVKDIRVRRTWVLVPNVGIENYLTIFSGKTMSIKHSYWFETFWQLHELSLMKLPIESCWRMMR